MTNYFVNTIDKTNDFKNGYLNLFEPDPILYRETYEIIEEDNPIIRYTMTLTGTADSKEDIIIPMSSFQCRYRSGDPSFISCVLPYTDDYAQYVTDRPNGEIVITINLYLPGSLELIRSEEIIRVDLENIRFDEGGKNKSITLEGHKTVGFESQSITLENCIYRMLNNGKLMLRFAAPHYYLRPKDQLTSGGDTITVGLITYYVSVESGGSISQQMDVQEAA